MYWHSLGQTKLVVKNVLGNQGTQFALFIMCVTNWNRTGDSLPVWLQYQGYPFLFAGINKHGSALLSASCPRLPSHFFPQQTKPRSCRATTRSRSTSRPPRAAARCRGCSGRPSSAGTRPWRRDQGTTRTGSTAPAPARRRRWPAAAARRPGGGLGGTAVMAPPMATGPATTASSSTVRQGFFIYLPYSHVCSVVCYLILVLGKFSTNLFEIFGRISVGVGPAEAQAQAWTHVPPPAGWQEANLPFFDLASRICVLDDDCVVTTRTDGSY
jgi:hypothetical protein